MNTRNGRRTALVAIVSVMTLLGSGTAYAGRPGSALFQQSTPGTYTWTVPKGLIRPGESPLSAAEREFAEETSNLAYYERRAAMSEPWVANH